MRRDVPGILTKGVFEYVEGLHVEIVGRLVEDEHV